MYRISNIEPFLSNGKLSSAELLESCRVMLVGGAETMATVVSGMLFYLLSNPSALSTLKSEIRLEFKTTDEINANAVQKITYLSAVIKESLRMFPPLPGNLRRITPPEGCVIGGQSSLETSASVFTYRLLTCLIKTSIDLRSSVLNDGFQKSQKNSKLMIAKQCNQ